MTLSPLSIKLFRDLWRLRAQSLAIAMVIAAGVAMIVMSFGMIRSLEATRSAYYERYRFADIFAPVRRAPMSALDDLRRVEGVAYADGRISADGLLDVPGISDAVSARIHSLPTPDGLNQLVVRSGRLPNRARPDEVVVSEAFAKAARLSQGARLTAVIYGKRVSLRLVGTVLSPEYVYSVAPGQIFPDNQRFGILWMNHDPLAGVMDLRESLNEVLLRLAPRAQRADVIRRVDNLLDRYGAVGAYGRDLQISDRFVSNEIDELATLVKILPPIFLAVAAFLLNIVLARLIDTEREVIGLLKAFGYRNRAIILHYTQLAVLLSLAGLVLGLALGALLGRAMATLYQQYFVFPFLVFRAGVDSYLVGAVATAASASLGTFLAVRRAAKLTPADAMRPPAPASFSAGWADNIAVALGPDEPSRMILRGTLRRPLRTALTVLGLSSAVALYIASASSTDNVDRMIELAFDRADRSDLTVTFTEPRDADALYALKRVPGILRVEPFRSTGARLTSGHRTVREGITGGQPDADLSRIVDGEGHVVEPRPSGLILSTRLARQLDVVVGDRIWTSITEGERRRLALPVAAIVDSPIGSTARLDQASLNRILREGPTLSGAHLAIDDHARATVIHRLKAMPQVTSVSSKQAIVTGIRDTIAEAMGIVTLFNSGLAMLIVFGVVYNSSRISLSERARDLASMRVLGFHRDEAAFVLLGELGLLVLAALGPGVVMGLALANYVTDQFSNDLYSIPSGLHPRTAAEGVLVIMVAAAATALLIRMRVDKLDLVRALKTRE